MEMGSRKEDEMPISQGADDNSSTSASGQPIETALRAAGIYVRRNQRPLSSGINRNSHHDRYWSEMEARKTAVYCGHHEYDNPLPVDEVPPVENVRSGSDVSSSRYQTPRHYDGPVIHAPYGYPYHLDSSVSNMVVVTPPGHSTGPVYVQPAVPDYTALSVIVILFCFAPVGICALINARDVHTHLAQGNIKEAMKSSRTARTMAIVAVFIGIQIIVGSVLLYVYV